MNRYPGFIAGLFLLVSGHLLAGEEPLIDTEDQKVMSSRSFLEAQIRRLSLLFTGNIRASLSRVQIPVVV